MLALPGGGVAVIIEDGDDTFDVVYIFNEVVPLRLYKGHQQAIWPVFVVMKQKQTFCQPKSSD